jgi:hypothetical protein
MPTLPQKTPSYDYPFEWDNLAVLPISTFEHWWSKQIGNKTRNMVRKAEKAGVVLREVAFDDALVDGICAIYNETPMRQGRRFWHYGKDRETVKRISATFPEQSSFVGAFLGEQLIGFAKLVWDRERQQASLMHIISMVQHRDKAPTNALIAESVKACAARGIPNLVYSNFAYGRKQKDSLSDFKEYNGFQRVEMPRYYIPVTAVGRAALRLQLHRGIVERLPDSIHKRLYELRSRWYAWRMPARQWPA